MTIQGWYNVKFSDGTEKGNLCAHELDEAIFEGLMRGQFVQSLEFFKFDVQA